MRSSLPPICNFTEERSLPYEVCGGMMLLPDVTTCTCNPATSESKFQNGVGLMPIGGNNSSIGRWVE